MGNPADAKYGFTREQLTEGFKQLKALGVKHFGLHSFLSSCNTDNMYYPTLAKLLFTVAKELHEEVGVEIAFINLSGGIGIPYKPEDTATDIAFVGEKVHEVYDEVFGGTDMHDHVYDITGSLCESNDRFAIDRPLPEINEGDILVIHDTGAHGFSMGYNYNGKLKSAEVLLKEDGSTQLIRRAETNKDYFATFDFLDMPRLKEER